MEFEHVGNALALELANSIPDRAAAGAGGSSERDWLRSAVVAGEWADSLGLPLGRPLDASDLLELVALREAIHDVFAAIAAHDPVPGVPLAAVTRAHADGLGRWGYTVRDGEVGRAWPDMYDVASLAARFADSAVAELSGDRLDRVKACPSCGWLFVDTTKNRSRRWCSMEMCGGRDKALRHYRKTRNAALS